MISVTKKEIWDCLLGKYDAEKESDFLAMCFSNDKNTEKYEIVREDLIESYLRGILSQEEKKLFEENFLKDTHHRELVGFAKTLRNRLSENKQLAEIASAKLEKKPVTFGNLLVPVGSLAVLAIVSILVWQVFLKKNGTDIVQTNPTPTPPTTQVSLTPTISPNQMASPLPSNNSNTTNSSVNTTPANNSAYKNQSENSSEKNKEIPRNMGNPLLAFGLPMGLKSGEEILKISQNVEVIKLEIPSEMGRAFLNKQENKFPKYNIKILLRSGDKEKIYDNDFDFDRFPKDFNVPANKFKDGNYQLIVTGISADGSSKELKGIESRFQVKIIKN